MPVGGAAGTVLTKVNATDYNTVWQAPSGVGLTWPLLAPTGTPAVPSYAFSADATSGMYAVNPGGGVLDLASAASRYVVFSGKSGALSAANAYWDGTWRYADHSQPASAIMVEPTLGFVVYTAPPGSDPVPLAMRMQISSSAATFYVPAVLPADPTTAMQAATKQYVDAHTSVGVTWPLLAPDGSQSAPSYAFASNSGSGIYSNGIGGVAVATSNSVRVLFTNTSVNLYAASLLWNTDNANDVGSSGANRPRDIYTARYFRVGSPTANTFATMYVTGNATTGAGQYGAIIQPVVSSTATTSGAALWLQYQSQAATFTTVTAFGLQVGSPTLGAGNSVTSMYGVKVDNQGATGVTSAYGVNIAAQSGASSTNIGLYNGGTSQLVGAVGINQAPNNTYALALTGYTLLVGQVGVGVGGSVDPSYDLRVANSMYVGGTLSGGSMNINGSVNAGGPISGQYFTTSLYMQAGTYAQAPAFYVGNSNQNERIRLPANAPANLSIESADGVGNLSGAVAAQMAGNGYWDGTNWQRFNVANPINVWGVGTNGLSLYSGPAGANPASLSPLFSVDNGGNTTIQGNLTVNGGTVTFANGNSINSQIVAMSTVTAFSTATTNTWLATPIAGSGNCQGRRLRITGTCGFYHSAANAAWYIGIMQDGVVQLATNYVYAPTAGQTVSVSFTIYITPPSGTHSYAICINNASTGTLTFQGASSGFLYVTEERA